MISYQSGKKNNKADALTRKLNKQPTDNEDERRKYSIRMLLLANRINHGAELQSIKEDHANWTNSDIDSNANDKTSPLPKQIMESN